MTDENDCCVFIVISHKKPPEPYIQLRRKADLLVFILLS